MDILITGAAGGIGAATVNLLVEKGCRVFAADIDRDRLASLPKSERMVPVVMDVTDKDSVDKALLEIGWLTDGLDVIVNNAGWFDQFPLVEARADQFEKILSINVLAAQRVVDAFFPLLHPRKGRVINVGSESALVMMPLQIYGMTKKMLDCYTDVLRQELSLLDMKVVTIRPGGHLTPFIQRSVEVLEDVDEESLYVNALKNVKRQGTKILHGVKRDPVHVANAIMKASLARRPRREYWVNVSFTFRVLQWLPRRWRESLFKAVLSRK